MTCPTNCECGRHKSRKGTTLIKCPANCRCGKHTPHTRFRQLTQTERMRMVTAERHARGIGWRGTPSEMFDWERAIVGLYRVFDQVYGLRWRKRMKNNHA